MEGVYENIGVGKTKLSIQLAKRYDGEIINADAMQMYKGLNVATAKVENHSSYASVFELWIGHSGRTRRNSSSPFGLSGSSY